MADLTDERLAEIEALARSDVGDTDLDCAALDLIAALREARAEIAAYQGRPEGALPGWRWEYGEWAMNARSDLSVSAAEGHVSWSVRPRLHDADEADRQMLRGDAPSPRAAMRAAEAAAKARGWLP